MGDNREIHKDKCSFKIKHFYLFIYSFFFFFNYFLIFFFPIILTRYLLLFFSGLFY